MALTGNAVPFKILKHLSEPDRPPPWSVTQFRPGWSDKEIADDLAVFFSAITDEFRPLASSDVPCTVSDPMIYVEPHTVAERIRSARKPLTAVFGDPLPSTINTNADLLAISTTWIINLAMSSLTWPSAWKEETQSAIPKSASPKSYEELRNISCTNFLAKILESFLFDRLSKEVKLKKNQYGGIKGTGTVHFLIDVYQKILDCLDDGKSAASLLAIDLARLLTG